MLLVIVGTTGTGKDKLADELVKLGVKREARPTTRPKRREDVEGERYDFFSDTDFTSGVDRGTLVCDRVHGDKGWRYGVYSDTLSNVDSEAFLSVITLDRLTFLDLYYLLVNKRKSRYIYTVNIKETSGKEGALKRILKHRKTTNLKEYEEMKKETSRRISNDQEDTKNTALLGADEVLCSTQISNMIGNDILQEEAKRILQNIKNRRGLV